MTKPQQPELRRTGLGGTDQDAKELRAQQGRGQRRGVDTGGETGPVPEENQPGHSPEVDQDKPDGPPPA